jgi:AcrR family transcriptional regulator
MPGPGSRSDPGRRARDDRRSQRTSRRPTTRLGIIRAGRDLLSTGDWRQFTLDAVASRAGVTRVTVYNQVRSKHGLLDAILTDLTGRARMDQLLTDTRDLPAAEALAAVVRRTSHFWHAERALLRTLFGLAALDPGVAVTLSQRENWRAGQMRQLLDRLTAESTGPARLPAADVLAGVVATTSFPAYDALGPVADDPDRAASVLDHLIRGLVA